MAEGELEWRCLWSCGAQILKVRTDSGSWGSLGQKVSKAGETNGGQSGGPHSPGGSWALSAPRSHCSETEKKKTRQKLLLRSTSDRSGQSDPERSYRWKGKWPRRTGRIPSHSDSLCPRPTDF